MLLRVSSDNVTFVRIRSTTSVCLLHGLVLLPCGISGNMTIPSKSLLSLLASCSLYLYVALPTTCLSSLPNCHEPLTFVTLPSKPLFGYVTALNKTPPARPNIGFTICHLAFSFPWVLQTQGSSYFTPPPPGQCSFECWSTCQLPVATRGNSGLAYRKFGQSEYALRTRYVQLLSGFVGTFGRLCRSCFTIVEMS